MYGHVIRSQRRFQLQNHHHPRISSRRKSWNKTSGSLSHNWRAIFRFTANAYQTTLLNSVLMKEKNALLIDAKFIISKTIQIQNRCWLIKKGVTDGPRRLWLAATDQRTMIGAFTEIKRRSSVCMLQERLRQEAQQSDVIIWTHWCRQRWPVYRCPLKLKVSCYVDDGGSLYRVSFSYFDRHSQSTPTVSVLCFQFINNILLGNVETWWKKTSAFLVTEKCYRLDDLLLRRGACKHCINTVSDRLSANDFTDQSISGSSSELKKNSQF